ncbi:MAG: SigB/SigF/SigG family RNA polymerase sigma factor [Armatimonadetes bacterium]|nr:SigB/SigF/SigG family RNA polymerase sigma factor [Armatimonadota bacterium]
MEEARRSSVALPEAEAPEAPFREPSLPPPASARRMLQTHSSGNSTLAPADVQGLLCEYARSRDPRLRERLVHAHERMVRYLAGRFGHAAGTTSEDLIQVGYIGLIAAIDRYDPSKGVSFVTYAVPTILGEIKRYFRDQTWGLKAPRRLRELGLALRRIREELEQRLGRPPTVSEMAAAAKVPEERLLQAMDLDRVYQPASLDAQLTDETGSEKATAWEAIGDEDPQMARIEEREALRRAVERLDNRQRQIIWLRFYEELSQAEVARRMGISQMHVSRLERQALTKLRLLLSA